MDRDGNYRIKLYVTGGTRVAELAVLVLRRLTRQWCGRIQSEVVDVLLHPELMFDDSLRPMPLIVREAPEPVITFQGELTDPEHIIRALRLDP